MANAVFDTLAAFNSDGKAVPFLAESITPNDTFDVWTVKLREGVSFHDGTPLNAEAVGVTRHDARSHRYSESCSQPNEWKPEHCANPGASNVCCLA